MTVCIAASCRESENEPRIVLCRDWRSEVPMVGSSEKQLKLRELSKEWVALMAGDTARARELCIRFEAHLKTKPFTEGNLADEARAVFQNYKEALADSYLRSTYGFSFRHLIDKGNEAFGEQFTQTCLDQISRITVGAELIVAGFLQTFDYVDNKPAPEAMICALSEHHEGDIVRLEDEYAVIGSGGNAAKTMLSVRQQDSETSLMRTIYAVYEAKAMSETVPGVGETVSIDVMYPDGKMMQMSDAGYDRCDELLTRFGIRDMEAKTKIDWFEMKTDYLEPLDSPLPDS